MCAEMRAMSRERQQEYDGGTESLKNGAQGKTLNAALLRMEIEVEEQIDI
jgi:hypothetical protein